MDKGIEDYLLVEWGHPQVKIEVGGFSEFEWGNNSGSSSVRTYIDKV